ncbi:LPS export ABC transporter periplasmic protein LptC [Labrys sedimenti]|uniref:LPS export ABC transporter periplasmic protein LptC n=1 Tax=Labrys sedimenti TaxID=3106036 RepID=UPI002ACAD854|nr:LPS export ABC transporter periplasmic protein LptC [Labrys sp. ZIDIC5]MDZ5450379.1 LPS export ABC transporter periplasmic protein LptC [Labrys sp. ZIDIC5]
MADIMDARVKIPQPAMPSRESAFKAARAHSRLVRFLKFAVPAIAVAGAGIFVFLAVFNPFAPLPIVVPDPVKPSGEGILAVERPHLTGSNNRGQKYDVTATGGTQKVNVPGVVSLTGLKAVITAPDQSDATLSAETGTFDTVGQLLDLKGDVRVKSTKGYDATLKSASIDLKASTVNSTEPVTVNLTSGTISGNGLSIVQGGSKILFKGGVSASFNVPYKPDTEDGADSADTPATPSDDAPAPDAAAPHATPPNPANPVQGNPTQ